jgi:hypothetical protein
MKHLTTHESNTTFALTPIRQGMNSLGQVLPIQFKTQPIMGYVRNFGHSLSHSKNKQNTGITAERDSRIASLHPVQQGTADLCFLRHSRCRNTTPTARLIDIGAELLKRLSYCLGQIG